MNVLLILATGRSASMFLHSLFDGHPEVVTYPSIHGVYSPFFDERYITSVESALEYLQIFARVHLHLEGWYDEAIGRLEGGNGNLHLERERFLPLLRSELERHAEPLTRAALVTSIHRAYGRYAGQDLARAKLMVEHLHTYAQLSQALSDFPDAWCVHTLRDPVAGYYGMIDFCLKTYGHFKPEILYKLTKHLFLEPWSHVGSRDAPFREGRYRVLRAEDLNARGEAAVRELAAWLGITYDPVLTRSTIGGRACFGNSSKAHPVSTFTGPRDLRAERASASYVERLRINALLRDQMLAWGYPEPTADNLLTRAAGVASLLIPLRAELRPRIAARWRDARADARIYPLASIIRFRVRLRRPALYRALRWTGWEDDRSTAYRALSGALLATLAAKRIGVDPWLFYSRRVALFMRYRPRRPARTRRERGRT